MTYRHRTTPKYDSRACSTNWTPRSLKRELRKGSLVEIADAEPAIAELGDGELIQEWEYNDQHIKRGCDADNADDYEARTHRQHDIEAEWQKRYPGIPISSPEPPPLTADDIIAETGLSRSQAYKRLRMGLPRDLLLASPGMLPRNEVPHVEKEYRGTVIKKNHLYKIAETAAALFNSKDPTHVNLVRLRDALEAAGIDLGEEEDDIGEDVVDEGDAWLDYLESEEFVNRDTGTEAGEL